MSSCLRPNILAAVHDLFQFQLIHITFANLHLQIITNNSHQLLGKNLKSPFLGETAELEAENHTEL